jgi:hypothetical protein
VLGLGRKDHVKLYLDVSGEGWVGLAAVCVLGFSMKLTLSPAHSTLNVFVIFF